MNRRTFRREQELALDLPAPTALASRVRIGHGRGRRLVKSFRLAWLGTVLAFAAPAFAQSAADKATARRLATEGIELHNQGKSAEALDRLQRAQALYDAPIHLLYIARAQAKLGQLVEASETYRRLVRVELAPGAPVAFRDALESGKREQLEVEARIGTLRVDVHPENIAGLKLTIDADDVSSAVVGIQRPVNPGRHVVTASAPGFLGAEASVEVAEKDNQIVELRLEPDPNARRLSAAATGAGPSASATAPSAEVRAEATRDSVAEEDDSSVNLFVGLRIGASLPGGSLYDQGGTQVSMSDYFGAGAAVELNAGAWFARYFGAKIYLEGSSFTPGRRLARLDEFDEATAYKKASAQAVGIAAMVGSPLRRFGAFGEVGLTFYERLAVTRDFEAEPNPCGTKFDQSIVFTGAAFRVGAGARIPVSRLFQLTPYVLASFGAANEVANDSSCAVLESSPTWPTSGDLDESVGHRMILFGLGGDLTFGLR